MGIGTLHVNTSMDKSVLMWPIQKQILFQTRGAVYANHDSARCTCPHLFWLCQGEISLTTALFEEFQLLLLPERIFFFNHSWNTGTVITEKNDKSFAWRTSRRSILGGKTRELWKIRQLCACQNYLHWIKTGCRYMSVIIKIVLRSWNLRAEWFWLGRGSFARVNS